LKCEARKGKEPFRASFVSQHLTTNILEMAEQPKKLAIGLDANSIARTVASALEEDIGIGDLTAELVNERSTKTAEVRTRQDCVLCGVPWFNEVFLQLCDGEVVHWHHSDGDAIAADTVVCTLEGPARVLLTGERTALNFLQLLSATATDTRVYVEAVQSTGARILDTRKTIPGLRAAQKYAVRCGGGDNHRQGLFDAILIKENHIAAAGGISLAVTAGRKLDPLVMLEVEVETLDELREALSADVDRIMLDNFSIPQLKAAVLERETRQLDIELEASGGIDLDEIRTIALTGVDFISVGALTKHTKAIDFSMRIL